MTAVVTADKLVTALAARIYAGDDAIAPATGANRQLRDAMVEKQFFSDNTGGGGIGTGGGIQHQQIFAISGSFVVPVTGKYLITAIGGGGGTAKYGGEGWTGGAGAGGLAQSLWTFEKGTVITFTVGAGGKYTGGGIEAPAGANAAGGTTIVTTPAGVLTARGGNTGWGPSPGQDGIGGTAEGGNIMNVQGGSGLSDEKGGGGAVGIFGYTPPTPTGQSGAVSSPILDDFSSNALMLSYKSFIVGGTTYPGTGFLASGRVLSPVGIGTAGSPNFTFGGASTGGSAALGGGGGGGFGFSDNNYNAFPTQGGGGLVIIEYNIGG